jgi:hypothetical protein
LRKCLLFARRWADARTLIQDESVRPAGVTAGAITYDDIFLAAEKNGSPAEIAKARNQALDAPSGANPLTANAIEALSALGLVDDAFAVANRYAPGRPLSGDSAFLFYPLTAPLRHDSRFMKLAARIGLVDYWRTSAKWPDFCTNPGLPYDCRKEADKLTAH